MNFLLSFPVGRPGTPVGSAIQTLLAAGALGISCIPAAYAADAEEVPSLPPVIVTDTAPAQTTVDRGHVERMRAATSDTASLLADNPGVSVRAAGGVSSFPVIQGVADDRLRIKVDGMDLTASCPNHMNTPLSYLPPSDVGVLRVHSNIAPVSVGGDSIGGGIIADSAAPKFARPGEGNLTEGELGAFYRSNGNARGANAAATFATDMFSLNYTGSTAKSNNYRAGGDFKTNPATGRPGHELRLDEVGSSAYLTRNQSLGFAVRPNNNHLIEARFSYQDIPYELYPNQRMDMLGNTARRFNLHYLGAFDWGELDARAYHETVDHHMDFGPDREFVFGAANGMPMNTDSKTTGAVVKARINLTDRDLLRVGGEYLRYRLDDRWPASAPSGMMGPNTFININNGKRDRTGAFAEWEANWTQSWLSLVGLRLERVTSDTGPVQGYNTNGMQYTGSSVGTLDAFNAMDRRRADNNWDFTALGRYTPNENSSYEFGFAYKTRSPNLYERYAWSMNGMAMAMNNLLGDGNGYLGNPNLKPEAANTLSVTGDWHSADGATRLRATPYYSHVNNYIDAVCSLGRHPMYNGNVQKCNPGMFLPLQYANQTARIYGIDISGQMPLAKTGVGEFGLKGLVSYTKGKNLDTGDGLYNIMPLNAKLTLTHEYAGWHDAIEWIGVKSKTGVSAVRNELKTPGYVLVNLRASYSWKKVRFDFGIENLFNKLYSLPTGGAYVGQGNTMGMTMPMGGGPVAPWGIAVAGMGRSFYLGMNIKF